jgi:transcriptional regulator with XRE-family HTH domain
MKEKTFGQVIRDFRIQNREYNSLREFARKIGLSPAYLSRIENEKEPPPSEAIIERMAEALGVDKYELFSHAGKIPTEFLETFQKNPKSVASFMRRAQEYGIETDKDWKTIEDTLSRMKRKSK